MSFLDKIKRTVATAANAAAEHARRHAIPIPERAVNLALPYLTKDVPEVQRLAIRVGEGQFELDVEAKKLVSFSATARFRFVEVDLSAERQLIVLQRLDSTRLGGKGIVERAVALVVEAVFFTVLKADPADYAAGQQPQVRVDGDRYTIDLGGLGAGDVLRRFPKAQQLLTLARVDDVRCVPGQFEAVLALSPQGGSALAFVTGFFGKHTAREDPGAPGTDRPDDRDS